MKLFFALKNRYDAMFFLGWIAIVVGFILSIVSILDICTESCSETHKYRFFGLPFGPIGLVFFFTLGMLYFFSRHYPFLTSIVALMTAGALGSEIVLIGIQKYVIGQWCPVCLSIAASIAVLAFTLVLTFIFKTISFYQQRQQGKIMINLWKGISCLSIFGLGFALAVAGVAKPEKSFADGIENQDDPIFGNKNSAVEVYIVSDWFCPACRRIEPVLDKMYPRIMKKAGLVFVDRAIHPETMNFTPYNLSFMVKEKKKYFEIRKALSKLSMKTKTPTAEQIQEAVKTLGVKYQQLNYTDIDSGIRYFQGIAKTFNINSTPTVVIANRKKLNAKKLVGEEITEANVFNAIDEIGQ